MKRYFWLVLATAIAAGCSGQANVAQEREALLAADRAWGDSIKDLDKFLAFYATDGRVFAPGMPMVTGADNIKQAFKEMVSAPGFSLKWAANNADVSSAGDLGVTSGTYEMTVNGVTDKGKFVTVWKKENGQWKVSYDVPNSDQPPPANATHAMVNADKLTWGPAPPSMPAGAKMAVVSGDPGKAEPFIVRAQLPAGYTIGPHWHPTDENVTVLSGTFALGMGDTTDAAKAENLSAGGVAVLPAQMHHYAIARTATTIQIHGMGPFVLNYVNPADDPAAAGK